MANFLGKVPTVKVGAHPIKVKVVKRNEAHDVGSNVRTLGKANYELKTIELLEDFVSSTSPSMILEVLIHEICHHIVWSNPGVSLGRKEEVVVEMMGKGFTDLLLNNPQLLEVVKHVAKSKG
jgi:predicted SprT family Zn-dependent metalloprotease